MINLLKLIIFSFYIKIMINNLLQSLESRYFYTGMRVADTSSFKRVRQVHGRYFRQRVQNGIEAEAKESRGAGRSQPAK